MLLYASARPACALTLARFATVEDQPGAVRVCRPGEWFVLLIEYRDR
jgi:hypothetical protein